MNNKHVPVLGAAGLALLVILVAAGMRGPPAKAPVPTGAIDPAQTEPANKHLLEIDWQGSQVFFPEPIASDGDYWMLAFMDESRKWQSKRVSSRNNGKLFTGFPPESKEIHVWVSGAQRPTYSVAFHKP